MKKILSAVLSVVLCMGVFAFAVSANFNYTPSQAKQIAFNHAGITEDQAKYVTVEVDIEEKLQTYEVEFYVGAVEYEYIIDASNGEILASKSGEKILTDSNCILETEALKIALENAGLEEKDVSSLVIKFDKEDAEYEIDFVYDGYEYEYEINATNGVIIGTEKEKVENGFFAAIKLFFEKLFNFFVNLFA